MHFLITGGLGFIGSHLVERLLGEDHDITIVDDLSSGCRDNIPSNHRIRLIEKDVLKIEEKDLSASIDGIAHLAAVPSVESSWLSLRFTHDCNLTASLRVMELCGQWKVPRLVFASSAAVYGQVTDNVPINENHPAKPASPYGLQKLASEEYGRLLSARADFGFIALRMFNVYGPRQPPNSPYSGVISRFIAAARAGKSPTIHGDGSQMRDFVFVTDVAAAFVKALTCDFPPGGNLTCNIGTGAPTSIGYLARTIARLYSLNEMKFNHGPLPVGDVPYSCSDISLARRYLGYEPGVGLQAGLASMSKQETDNG